MLSSFYIGDALIGYIAFTFDHNIVYDVKKKVYWTRLYKLLEHDKLEDIDVKYQNVTLRLQDVISKIQSNKILRIKYHECLIGNIEYYMRGQFILQNGKLKDMNDYLPAIIHGVKIVKYDRKNNKYLVPIEYTEKIEKSFGDVIRNLFFYNQWIDEDTFRNISNFY